jgi:hypothetical protein
MKKIVCKRALAVLFLFSPMAHLSAQQTVNAKATLARSYNLVSHHSKDTQYYVMESKLQKQALDGKIQGIDIYRLYLRCIPSATSPGKDEYTCLRFTVQVANSPVVSIPSLANWKYLFSLEATTDDNQGQLFGIDHRKFEKLADESGKNLPFENTFHVYNAFIDFHTMSVFAEKTAKDSGVQDLKHIGDTIVHAASYSQPPTHLGAKVSEGSYFKNGKITLEFKGLALVNEKTTAVLGYDSGQSSFYMLTKPMADMEVSTKGSSHYWGDIYKDLAAGWIQKAVLHELVISETTVAGMNNKINSVIERSINIKNVTRITF